MFFASIPYKSLVLVFIVTTAIVPRILVVVLTVMYKGSDNMIVLTMTSIVLVDGCVIWDNRFTGLGDDKGPTRSAWSKLCSLVGRVGGTKNSVWKAIIRDHGRSSGNVRPPLFSPFLYRVASTFIHNIMCWSTFISDVGWKPAHYCQLSRICSYCAIITYSSVFS